VRYAGHNKWSNIKHIKAAKDLENSKKYGLFTNRIQTAIKNNGGNTDPEFNTALRKVLEEARVQKVPKVTIEKAIKNSKNIAELSSEFIWEIRGPGRSSVIVECLAKKRSFVQIAMNPVMRKNGSEAEQGLAKMFEKKGIIVANLKENTTLDDAESDGIEVGAEEVEWAGEESDGLLQFQTDPMHLSSVETNLVQFGYVVEEAAVYYIPRAMVELSGIESSVFQKLLNGLHDLDIVTAVHHNAAF